MGLPKSRDGTFPVADWFWIGWAPARVIGAASLALATNWPGEARGNQLRPASTRACVGENAQRYC